MDLAALQYAQGGNAPTLLQVETKAGHGAGKPTDKLIDEVVDRYAFLVKVLDVRAAAHPDFGDEGTGGPSWIRTMDLMLIKHAL